MFFFPSFSTNQVATKPFASRKDISFLIAEAKNLYTEKINNANFIAEKGKEMIEYGRKRKVEDITQLLSKLTKTIEDECYKINKIFEKLKKL